MRTQRGIGGRWANAVVVAGTCAMAVGGCRSKEEAAPAPALIATPPAAPAAAPAPAPTPAAAPVDDAPPAIAAALKTADALLADESPAFAALVKAMDALDTLTPDAKTPAVEARVTLAFYRLLARATDGIEAGAKPTPEQAALLSKHERVLVFSEPAGQYFVDEDELWNLADKYAATPTGDAFAWFAAKMPAAGECEGDASCYLERSLNGEARYLKAFPKGVSAFDALLSVEGVIPNDAAEIDAAIEQGADSVKEALTKLGTLRTLVQATEPSSKKDQVLAAIAASEKKLQAGLQVVAPGK